MKLIRIRNKLAYFFLVIGILYCSGLSYANVGSVGLKVVFLILTIFGNILLRPTVNVKISANVVTITILLTAIGAILSYFGNTGKNVWLDPVILIVMMLSANMFAARISLADFKNHYGKIMALFALIAILISIMVGSGIEIPSFVYENSRGQVCNTIWICTWIAEDSRVMGPFWEPGLFSSFLIIGIFFETVVFQFERDRLGVVVCLILGVLFSQSTAGYLLLLLVLYMWFHKTRKIQFIWDVIALLLIGVGLFFQDYISLFLYGINEGVFWKLTTDSVTGNTRLMSPIICFNVFLENPICGNGLSYAIERYNELKLSMEISSTYRIDALTSTNTFYLAAFGICGIGYTFCWIKALLFRKEMTVVLKVMIFMLFMIILNKEPHYNLMLTYIILFYLSNESGREKCAKVE